MTTAMTTLKKWQDGYLTTLVRVEEPVVKFTVKAVDAIAQYVPERPNWAFLEEVPTITEFVDSQLKFRGRIVDEQTKFVRRIVKAMAPVLTRLETQAPAAKRVVLKPTPVRRAAAKAA